MGQTRQIAIAVGIHELFPHHQRTFAGIQHYAREHPNWRCIIDEHPLYKAGRKKSEQRQYDGVIARASPELQRRAERAGIPLINVWYQAARPGLAGVYLDPEQCGRLAAEHLLERGFRRLSIMNDPQHKHTHAITAAFARRATEAGGTCVFRHFPQKSYEDRSYWIELENSLAQWLELITPPAGIFVEVPAIARLTIEMAQSRGWRVPQDLAIICQHNMGMVLEVSSPQITAIDDNYERVGYEAAELLDRLMAGEPIPQGPILLPPRGLVARESTDYFAVDDEVVAEALRYIASHLREPLGVERIAEAVAVSPRSLQMRFDKALGLGVSEEVRRLRLEAAKRMLADPDLPIGNIADLTGLGSATVMGQIFRRELGVNPSTYRSQIIGDNR